ncbi:unnamed protein product, partial [Brassica oleracea]
ESRLLSISSSCLSLLKLVVCRTRFHHSNSSPLFSEFKIKGVEEEEKLDGGGI